MPEPVNLAFAFNLPPAQALEYFRAKGYRVNPDGWAAVEASANRKAFTVARVASLDLLQDIKSSMDKAMANGTTFAQFQRELMPKMKALGWWGKDERGVQLGSPHRLSTIFRTNAQTSYMEGRWRGLMENVDNRPWIEYVAILDSRTRPGHRALNGKVFRYDDPFWRTHRPPLGWNCRCRIRALNDRDLERRGITPDQGEGNLKQYTPEAQGYRQPQAGYVDPRTGTETRTDIGWGYDRLEGWTPPTGRYDPG
ncbi:MAG: phage head morphogenesis protein, partial [Methylococcus sp.]